MSLPMEVKTEWAVKHRLKMASFCLFLQFPPLHAAVWQASSSYVTRAWKPSDRLRSTKAVQNPSVLPQPSPPQIVFFPFLWIIWNSSERDSAGLWGQTGTGAPRLARGALPWWPRGTTGARRRRDRSRRSRDTPARPGPGTATRGSSAGQQRTHWQKTSKQ